MVNRTPSTDSTHILPSAMLARAEEHAAMYHAAYAAQGASSELISAGHRVKARVLMLGRFASSYADRKGGYLSRRREGTYSAGTLKPQA